MTSKNNDFVIINREGINLIALGDTDTREIIDSDGNERIIHSLASMNYLKVDKGNFIKYACAKQESREV